jgi:pimeloyl-ACP methyl ester carboxylesterase
MKCATKLIWSIIGLLCAAPVSAQQIHRHVLAASYQPELRRAKSNSVKRIFYQLNPASSPARGLLVLLPGRGQPARGVFKETRLAQEAAQRGFVVLVLELNNRICLNAADTRFLDEAIGQAVRQNPALGHQLVLGGFSAGGQLAVAYAEKLARDSTQRPWRVRALLGVDPPLDLAAHYNRSQYHLAQQDCPIWRGNDQRIVSELASELGGSPAQVSAAYLARSAYSRSDSVGGNAQWLSALPVRMYCEPDLAFWQQQYCATLQPVDFNAYNIAAFIAQLQRLGNKQAYYIQTTGKGFSGKQRMPHSWSIVDAADCAAWLQGCLK